MREETMSEKLPQTFENHAKIVPLYHYALFGFLLINLLWEGWGLVRDISTQPMEAIMSFLLAFALIMIAFYARVFPLQAQDRVIRLEMRLRLQEVLPEDLRRAPRPRPRGARRRPQGSQGDQAQDQRLAARSLPAVKGVPEMSEKTRKSEEEWRRELSPEQYRILRQKGTERAFTGRFWDHKEAGTYRCAGCGEPLFSSDTKFESGSGWPSFYRPLEDEHVETEDDRSLGMQRTEVLCSSCGGHLGHVFEDGPRPTGLRYCINSASLDFEPEG